MFNVRENVEKYMGNSKETFSITKFAHTNLKYFVCCHPHSGVEYGKGVGADASTHGCKIFIGKHPLLPQMQLHTTFYGDREVFHLDDIRALTPQKKDWLKNTQVVQLCLVDKYDPNQSHLLVELLNLMPNIWHIFLDHFDGARNANELLEDLAKLKLAKQIKTLQLDYCLATKTPIADYFPAINALHMANTRPIHMRHTRRNQIERFAIATLIGESTEGGERYKLSERNIYEFTANILRNGAVLQELYILTSTAETFRYFRRIVEVIKAPRMEKIFMDFTAKGVKYVVRRNKTTKSLRRELIVQEASRATEIFNDAETEPGKRLRIDFLDLEVKSVSDLKTLVKILDPKWLGRMELKGLMDASSVAAMMSDVVRDFHHIEQFSLDEGLLRVSIKKFTDKQNVSVLEATISNGRYYDLFTNAQKVQLTLKKANDDSVAAYAEWLVLLDDAVEIDIRETQYKLFELALAKIAGRTEKGLKTWPKLMKISATITVFDKAYIADTVPVYFDDINISDTDRNVLTTHLMDFIGKSLRQLIDGTLIPTLRSFSFRMPNKRFAKIVSGYSSSVGWKNVEITDIYQNTIMAQNRVVRKK